VESVEISQNLSHKQVCTAMKLSLKAGLGEGTRNTENTTFYFLIQSAVAQSSELLSIAQEVNILEERGLRCSFAKKNPGNENRCVQQMDLESYKTINPKLLPNLEVS
jgi:hypothetical protein